MCYPASKVYGFSLFTVHDEHFEEYRDEILDGTHKVLIFVKKIKRLNEWHPDIIINSKPVLCKEISKFHAKKLNVTNQLHAALAENLQ